VDQDSAAGLSADAGVTSLQFVVASALALLLFLALANLVVVQYGRGAIRSALEQGARAGTVSGVDVCESIAADVIADLLGGAMSRDLVLGCQREGQAMVASASATFQSWTPMTPDFSISLVSRAVAEP
jgi:hypothetical protein